VYKSGLRNITHSHYKQINDHDGLVLMPTQNYNHNSFDFGAKKKRIISTIKFTRLKRRNN